MLLLHFTRNSGRADLPLFYFISASLLHMSIRLSRLDCPTAKPDGAVNGGRSPFILTVDWLGWVCYLFFYDLRFFIYRRVIVLNVSVEIWNPKKYSDKNVYQNYNRQYNSNCFPDTA